MGNGNDTVEGGSGPNDTYDVADATDAVTVDLGAGTSTGGSGTDTLTQHRGREWLGRSTTPSLVDRATTSLYGEGGNDTHVGRCR